MTIPPSPDERAPASSGAPDAEVPTRPKAVGRPKGTPSTIINVRLPLALVAQLDRYLDRLEWRTGLKANRGMIMRRALEVFLTTHATDDRPSATV
jgi:hypothetical protein